MALLTLEGVSKAFSGVQAVRQVSFTVPEGAVLGVMGPNGSGKTTLFNLIGGALRPDRGRIRLREADITGLSPHRVCAGGIARTFQHVRPFPGLTALENVLVGQLYGRRGTRGRTAAGEAERQLALVGLEGKGHLKASRLTLMERRRLELARALATGPDLLLLDEFMAGLNETETAEAMRMIRRVHGQGVTLVLVEHIVWALLDLSQRIVVLSAGEKIADGPPGAVAADPAVVDAYLGRAGPGGSPRA
ncbi:MAG TPA: ABC transporter ATP-binding protein [Methylomirabilota bacterium]|jgi:branched-chain amino acid transport system ATP-binding protein|nr:ABC transporter ATP-binding protein [Methylomirabilota bacterium]